MQGISVLFLIRMGLALAAGLTAAGLLRKHIRVLVTRATPVHRRMAGDFYKRSRRVTLMVGLIIVVAVGILVDWGMRELERLFTPEKSEKVEFYDDSEPKWNDRLPDFLPPEESEPELPVEAGLTPPNELAPELLPPPPPSQVDIRPETIAPAPQAPSGTWYLQIYAFQYFENAQRQLGMRTGRGGASVRIGLIESDFAPYKILLGPFPSHVGALRYREERRIKGFPRNEKELILFK
jgi:hypothetical protein